MIDPRKRSYWFPEPMLAEVQAESKRLDRSLSWMLQRAWRLAKGEIRKLPGAEDKEGGP